MTWLRHAGRHVHATVVGYVREQLTELDWMDPEQTPFGAPAVTIRDTPAINGDGALEGGIRAGTVAISLGDEAPSDMQEMGGPLAIQEYPMFFDVFFNEEAHALSCASDIRDILMGRLDGTRRHHDLINQANGAVVVGWKLEVDDVERVSPEHRFPLRWHVVKATCTAYFPEVLY